MRLVAACLILVSSFVIVSAQITEGPKTDAAKPSTPSVGVGSNKLRDLPFPAGVDLQFVIKSLARDLEINVLFDIESFRTSGRKTFVDIKNVTASEALDYILAQEGLFFEEVGPKTILVAFEARRRRVIPEIGVRASPMTEQLAQYFGADGGLLVESVDPNSAGSKAGLRAGDVIVEIYGEPVKGTHHMSRAIKDKNGADAILTIVRDRKRETIAVTPTKVEGISSIL